MESAKCFCLDTQPRPLGRLCSELLASRREKQAFLSAASHQADGGSPACEG